MGLMKRTTVSLPDDLEAALERYRSEHEAQAPLSAVVQVAIREFLNKRGYARPNAALSFRLTPAAVGSGAHDVSVNHDRYLAESSHAP